MRLFIIRGLQVDGGTTAELKVTHATLINYPSNRCTMLEQFLQPEELGAIELSSTNLQIQPFHFSHATLKQMLGVSWGRVYLINTAQEMDAILQF